MIAATLIGAMTGVGGAAVLVLGMLAIPAMIRRGYDVSIAIGGLPPGGALGEPIPPTVIGVLLGGFTGIPVGSLFFGGFLPGLVIALGFCGWILLRCLARPELAPPLPREERPSFAEKLRASRQVAPAPALVALVALVLGTIWFGVATPTEAAGIGAFGTPAVAFLSEAMGRRSLLEALRTSSEVSIMVVSLLVGGSLFTRLLQLSGRRGCWRT